MNVKSQKRVLVAALFMLVSSISFSVAVYATDHPGAKRGSGSSATCDCPASANTCQCNY